MVHVFVYGTLKEGFANFAINQGRRVPGVFRTVQRYPLHIVTRGFIPWLVDRPGSGEHVLGQVFEVDDGVLREMDQLEQIDDPGWYTRAEIEVQPADATEAAATRRVFVYFGDAERLATDVVHAGPLKEFTASQDRDYRDAAA